MPAANRMLIVDGHAYAYRSFHAIRQLSSPSGAPTNAIYGFIQALGRMLRLKIAWRPSESGIDMRTCAGALVGSRSIETATFQ